MPDHRWLVIRLEAPLMAFGGVTIDQVGVTRDFPAASMLAGLLANALGYRRTEWEKHQTLQDRLIFAVRWEREGDIAPLTDTQNAQLDKSEKGWTTWGHPEGRAGASFNAPHRRRRDYHADASTSVVLRLNLEQDKPDLDDLAEALGRPARPLFIGRKPCLPSVPLCRGFVSAPTAYAALEALLPDDGLNARLRAIWPIGEGPTSSVLVSRIIDIPDTRNWRTGLHGGVRRIVEGLVEPPECSS